MESERWLECQGCGSWGFAPKGFNETKHFGRCPKCQGTMAMFLTAVIHPVKDLALRGQIEPEVTNQ